MISIVTPTYNDFELLKKEIPQFLQYLKVQNYDFELIVVDDGSLQQMEVKALTQKWKIKFLCNETNMGKGAAVRKGMLAASGDICIFTDCDIPYQYQNIDNMIRLFSTESADIVLGDRTLSNSQYFNKINPARKIGSYLFSFFVRTVTFRQRFDTQCGLKAFRGDVAKQLFSQAQIDSFAFDVEILAMAIQHNYKISKIPVQFRTSLKNSNVSLLKHGYRMFMDILKIKRNLRKS